MNSGKKPGKVVRNTLLSLTALVLILLSGGIYYVETEYGGIGLPWTTELELPAFPDYPAPQDQLSADQSGEIYFQTYSPFDLNVLLEDMDNALPTTGKGHLVLPDNASADAPVPAMILLHGSGGIAEGREFEHAKALAARGYAAFVLDYYEPRGVTSETPYMFKVLSVTETDIITDTYAALRLLGSHPAIDAERIGVMGFSYGAMVTRYTMDPRMKAILAPDLPRLAVHADFYGPCHQNLGVDDATGAPYLSVRGTEDASIDIAKCKEVESSLTQAGTPVDAHVLEGVGHAWESLSPRKLYPDSPYVSGCTFSFDQRGFPTVDGQPVTRTEKGASRGERALARAALMQDVPQCLFKGYIIGRDEVAHHKARELLFGFLNRHLKPQQSAAL